MLMYEKKDDLKQKGKSKEQKKKSRDVVQAKYMNGTTGEILSRPPETRTITAAKDKAKKDQEKLPLDRRVDGFTAHHKYPWSSIKGDIELASTAPKTDDSKKTLKGLEEFSGCSFPIKHDDFVKDRSHRDVLYKRNESKIDDWIQDVCWTPSNIFIGPLSEQREDDPTHRTPATEIDAHYIRRRRMSDVSEKTMEMYLAGGLKSLKKIPNPTGSVSVYNPDEWKRDEMVSDTKYFQIGDPYYEENIFHYKVDPEIKDLNYQMNQFDFCIDTSNDITQVQIRYDEKNCNTKTVNQITINPSGVQDVAPSNKRWSFSINITIASNYNYENFMFGMKKSSGIKKIVGVKEIFLRSPVVRP